MTSLLSNESTAPKCCYCKQPHPSTTCKTVIDVVQRKQILKKAGRCFVCLKWYHMSHECHSSLRCFVCNGRHYVIICTKGATTVRPVIPTEYSPTDQHQLSVQPSMTAATTPPTTSSVNCVNAKILVLLQTAMTYE